MELTSFIDVLAQPLNAFFISQSSLYWPYLISAFFIAIGLSAISAFVSKQSFTRLLGEQFSKRIWWGASTRIDYLYFALNTILFGSLIAPLMLASIDMGVWVHETLKQVFGPNPTLEWDAGTARIIYTVCFFVAYDFGRFFAHWLQHQFDVLWQFHKVHHSAEALTPFTSFRVHPVDLFLMGMGGNLFGGFMTGIFFYLTNGEITVATFLGTHVLIAVYSLIGNLRHSHVWLDYGVLGYVFISPAQHQIHHSLSAHHIGKNCGFALAFWDGLFGTLYVPKQKEDFTMGLGDGTDGTWHTLSALYLRPFVLALQSIQSKKWRA